MISIISLLAWIMCSHVVVSQLYKLEEVSHASGSVVGAESISKNLLYNGKRLGTIDQGDCLQVRDDSTDPAQIKFHVKLNGMRWRGGRGMRMTDTTVEADLERGGYPQAHMSVWSATPPAAGRCNDPISSYRYETKLIGHKIRGPMRARGGAAGLVKPKKKKKKKTMKSLFVKEKHTEPLKTIDEWKFETDPRGKKLFHFGEHICTLMRGESLTLQQKGEKKYEYGVFHLKTNGKWEINITGGDDDESVIGVIAEHEHDSPNEFVLWLKKLDGTKKEVALLTGTGFAGAAADAYVEYEDEMEGFASKYDELLDQFEYDVEIEAAREKKAMTHLAKEKYEILRAKNRGNEYW